MHEKKTRKYPEIKFKKQADFLGIFFDKKKNENENKKYRFLKNFLMHKKNGKYLEINYLDQYQKIPEKLCQMVGFAIHQ